MKRIIDLCFCIIAVFVLVLPVCAEGGPLYTDPDTGYSVYIQDDADILSPEEEAKLAEDMKPVTEFGNAVFVSNTEYNSSTPQLAKEYYRTYSGTDSGTLFMVDMYNRYIYIYSDGEIYKTVTRSYADTITDNTYAKASKGLYYECASEAFGQIHTLLEGGKVARPMKVITNILMAVCIAVILNYELVMISRRKKYVSAAQAAEAISSFAAIAAITPKFLKRTKTYIPPASVSSGGGSSGGYSGGGGGGGFSGGGGGSSGGGGGHRF
ncbi:MAG: TPM domain-containing protein [Solobacterium sp.]|nr:TPM domain-containing protein [Solobacterium sp.]